MGTGIIVCGLNGAGKTTLGKALAEKLNFHHIDHEDLCFPKTDPSHIYASPRSSEEVRQLLLKELTSHENLVFTSVTGDFGEPVRPLFQYAIWLDVPQNIRLQRVKNRSFQMFGSRILPGGDLYEQEEAFFHFVKSRSDDTLKKYLQSLTCPIIQVDGTKPIENNINHIIKQLSLHPSNPSHTNLTHESHSQNCQ